MIILEHELDDVSYVSVEKNPITITEVHQEVSSNSSIYKIEDQTVLWTEKMAFTFLHESLQREATARKTGKLDKIRGIGTANVSVSWI